jgi:thiamine-monophosphate kinase
MSTRAPASGEDRLIARHFRPLARHPGAFGLEDDAASITPPTGCDLVVTTDALVSGVHFFPDDPPDAVGSKSLRVNLSDLAAKGAQPLGFLLALALPDDFSENWLASFAEGLGADADAFNCPLLGGDTVRTTGPTTINISAFGAVKNGQMVRRAGAQPGDLVVVTGTIGDAAIGLLLRKDPGLRTRLGLSAGQLDELVGRYLRPQPRSAIAELLPRFVSAAMDVSDGLVGDLEKLCRVSNVAAEIQAEHLPLSDAARAALAAEPAVLETIITGGDDYEILATAASTNVGPLCKEASARGVAISVIGRVASGDGGVQVINPTGKPIGLRRRSFSHF